MDSSLDSVNLDRIWQQATNAIELNTVRVLLVRCGKLVAVENSIATISIQSMPLLEMVKRFLPSVEKAFSASLQQPVTVTLVVERVESQSEIVFPSTTGVF